MFSSSYIFKSKAVRALKGNWQTALIVSFLAGLPTTVYWLLTSTQMPDIPSVMAMVSIDAILEYVQQIPQGTLWLVLAAGAITFLVTPVLSVSCNFYFIRRMQGEDLGIAGTLSRRQLFWRALGLSLLTTIKSFLWGLLFIVPGYIAMLRYAMAPYFLAENPQMTPTEAIEKSKEVMADQKLGFFLLILSFIGWWFMANVVQVMLLSFSPIIALVAFQFVDLFRITYTNAAVSAFYLAVSRTEGMDKAKQEADAFVRALQNRVPGTPPYGGRDTEDDDSDDRGEDKP